MKKTEKTKVPYMMNRELSWLKFNERVLNEAGNPRVPLAERLTFAAIYQSNLDEFYRVRVGTLMDQMESSDVVCENKTNMTSEEQVKAILTATRELDQKKDVIYEQLMGELEPKGIRLIDIPTRKGTFMLSEELILHFLPKMFKNYEVKEKSLLRITRNADIDTETIYDEDLDYRDAMETLIKQRKRMNPVRMELSRELNKKMISSLCKDIKVEKSHVFISGVPLDMSFVFSIQSYLKNTDQESLFYQRRTPRMTPELDEKSCLIPQIMKKDALVEAAENGKEAADVFAALLRGETVEETSLLLVAPKCLQNKVLDMIEEEIQHVKQGDEGYIGVKINSLTEKGNYVDRSVNDVKLNSQEMFYAMAYSNAEKQ